MQATGFLFDMRIQTSGFNQPFLVVTNTKIMQLQYTVELNTMNGVNHQNDILLGLH